MRINPVIAAAACLGLLLVGGCATAPRGPGGTARISSVEGLAEIAHGGGPWVPARLWQKLGAGDQARTSGSGKIDLSLGRFGGVLTVMPESLVEFEQVGPSLENSRIIAVLNLREGRLVGDTLKLPEGTRVQIKTRTGVHEIP